MCRPRRFSRIGGLKGKAVQQAPTLAKSQMAGLEVTGIWTTATDKGWENLEKSVEENFPLATFQAVG